MHSKKLSAKARKAILARMTPEQIQAEERAKMAIVEDFYRRHGLDTSKIKVAA